MHPNDPSLKSFVEVVSDSHFPIQNLPFGVFSTDAEPAPADRVAIGDQILDLAVFADAESAGGHPHGSRVFNRPSLNAFIALGQDVSRGARASVSELLRHDSPRLRDDQDLRSRALVAMADAPPSSAGGDRRLHRLLFVKGARHQCRHDVP